MYQYTLTADDVLLYQGGEDEKVWEAMKEGRKDPVTYSSKYRLEINGEVVDILKWQETYLFANQIEE